MDQTADPHQNEQEIVEITIECGPWYISCEVKAATTAISTAEWISPIIKLKL